MQNKIIKLALILIFVILIFHGSCKSPFTPSETLPVIWINAFTMAFTCSEYGPNPVSQILKVKNIGPDTLEYTIKDDADFYDVDWLIVNPDRGASSGEVIEHNISIIKDGMNSRDQDYTAKITISSAEAYNSPQTVDVTLKLTEEPPPEIEVTPENISFNALEGAVATPNSKNIKIRNSGNGILNYSLSDDANWLEINPASGSSQGQQNTHAVSVNSSGLTEGTHTGTITITDLNAANSPKTVNVTLVITKEPPPVIEVSPSSLSFGAQVGGSNPAPQGITIRNSGQQTLNYTVSAGANWMDVDPKSGSSTGGSNAHTVSLNIAGLSIGTHTATITITDSNAANSPQTVAVTLNIASQPPPEIEVSPASLSFSAQEGGSNPSAQSITVRNSGQQTLSYTISDDADWLDVKPKSGNSKGAANSHTVSVDMAGLSTGTYSATIAITDSNASNSPRAVDVKLKITTQVPPEIWFNKGDFSFSAQEGGSNPASQKLKINNSGQQTLNYTISDDANWLDVDPKSGSSQGETNTHGISVDIAGLTKGTYTGTVTIKDPNASNSPQTVSVDLTITAQSPPQIWVSTGSLSFSAQEGGSNPSVQSIDIRNSGQQTLNYTISINKNWLNVNPTSGTSTGGTNTHNVSVDIAGMGSGTYSGTITIADPNASNSPQYVSVTLQITSAPTQNEISVSRSPKSGGTGTVVDVAISIKGNINEIKAFGLDLTFDPTMFSYQGFSTGDLTGNWSGVDANETTAGTVKVGGWGGTNSIPAGSSGSIVVIQLKVTCSGCSINDQSDICISKFTDDIKSMSASPGCVTFTYK